MSNKRQHKTLALKDKIDILKKLDSGETMSKLAKEYGVGRATIYDLKKKKQKIMDHVSTMERGPGKRKTLRSGHYPDMENALYAWFVQERSKDAVVNGENLKAKAIEFYQKFTNKNEFRASDGWLDKFKNRFGIRLSAMSDDKLSNDASVMQSFIQNFNDRVKELCLLPDQMYNADVSSIFWTLMPNKIIASSEEASSHTASKERITFMPCSNATGIHKLDLLVIGRMKDPEAFKNIAVCYKKQVKSLITRELLNDWFHNDFVPEVKKFMRKSNFPEKALLILGNAPGYPYEQEVISSCGNIQTIFLPPNLAPLLHPMEQNVVQKVKSLYKHKLLLHIISQDGDISQLFKELKFQDVVLFLYHAWNSVSHDIIQLSWKNLWPTINTLSIKKEELAPEDNPSISDWLEKLLERGFEISEEDLSSWLEGTEELEQFMTDEEICEEIKEEDSINEKVEPTNAIARKNPETVLNCFNTCIEWAEGNGVSNNDITVLRNLREQVFNQEDQKKQTSIRDYVKSYKM